MPTLVIANISSPPPKIGVRTLEKGILLTIRANPSDLFLIDGLANRRYPIQITEKEYKGPAIVARTESGTSLPHPAQSVHTLKFRLPQQPQIARPTAVWASSCVSCIRKLSASSAMQFRIVKDTLID